MTDVSLLLKQTRQHHGMSLEQVAQSTYIKLPYLEALEEGRFDTLPAPVYTYGYIRRYAKVLGLDGSALVAQYQRQEQSPQLQSPAPERSAPMADLPDAFNRFKATLNGQTRPNGNGSNGHSAVDSNFQEMLAVAEGDPTDIRQAKMQASQIIAAAEREASRMMRGAEQYAESVLAQLDGDVAKTLQIIQNGRQFLHSRRNSGR